MLVVVKLGTDVVCGRYPHSFVRRAISFSTSCTGRFNVHMIAVVSHAGPLGERSRGGLGAQLKRCVPNGGCVRYPA